MGFLLRVLLLPFSLWCSHSLSLDGGSIKAPCKDSLSRD